MPRWDAKQYGTPVKRMKAKNNATWYLWVIPGDRMCDADDTIVVASEQAYSTVYSRLLRVGDIVVSAGEYGDSTYIPPKGTRGVLLEIYHPYKKGKLDYVFRVAFEGKTPINVKASHLVYQKHQQIKIGRPTWR